MKTSKVFIFIAVVLMLVVQFFYVRNSTEKEVYAACAVATAEALFEHGGFEDGIDYIEYGHTYNEWASSKYAERVKVLTLAYAQYLLEKAVTQKKVEADNSRSLAKWYAKLSNDLKQ